MRLQKIIFSGIVMVLLSSCGDDSGGSDEGENNAPTVNAGVDKSVMVNETVSLNGVANDSDGSIVAYEWREGNKFLTNTQTLDYLPTTIGGHTITLTVTDDDGATASDNVRVMVVDEGEVVPSPVSTPTPVPTTISVPVVTPTPTPVVSSSTLSKGLVAHYEFEGNANDSSGNGNDGVEHGDVGYTNGVIGKAGSFDGKSKIVIDAFKNFKWGQNFSVTVWFKRIGEVQNYQGIINNGYGSNGSWEIRMGREKEGTLLGGGINTSTSPKSWDFKNYNGTNNIWHNVIMTYDGDTLLYFVDGVSQTRSKDSSLDKGEVVLKNTPVTIGQAGLGMVREFFYGEIDEFRIYNRALNETEIAELYEMGQ